MDNLCNNSACKIVYKIVWIKRSSWYKRNKLFIDNSYTLNYEIGVLYLKTHSNLFSSYNGFVLVYGQFNSTAIMDAGLSTLQQFIQYSYLSECRLFLRYDDDDDDDDEDDDDDDDGDDDDDDDDDDDVMMMIFL